MNEDGNGSPHAAPTVVSISSPATTKRTGASSEQKHSSPSSLGKRARSSGNSLDGNGNLQGGKKRNAETSSHAVDHFDDGGRGAVTAARHSGRASKNAPTTNAAASNSRKNNANINNNANANANATEQVKSPSSTNNKQWFDVDGKRYLVPIDDNV